MLGFEIFAETLLTYSKKITLFYALRIIALYLKVENNELKLFLANEIVFKWTKLDKSPSCKINEWRFFQEKK